MVTTQSGLTLVEVLVALFGTGVGLLALLTLFPLGALDLAQAIKDDRAAAVAVAARALSDAGEELLSRTAEFVSASLSNGSVDSEVLARLRQDYEDLALQAADVESKLLELQALFPRQEIQRHLARLLAQIRIIRHSLDTHLKLLSLGSGTPEGS